MIVALTIPPRLVLCCLASGALAACSAPDPAEPEDGQAPAAEAPEAQAEQAPDASTLTGAVEGPWRRDSARIRDGARHPVQTLEFFDIDPSGRVIEIWPGAGWYADILAPWISANGGTYVAAWPPIEETDAQAAAFRGQFQARFDGRLRGSAELIAFGPQSPDLGAPGSADAVVTFRNVHSFMGAGFAETAFDAFFTVLRPGGVLGVVQHRLPADRVQDPRAASGYVQQDYVIALAREAGFELVETSEINANPADTADHPFGVWTLAPVARTSPFGEPADRGFDRTGYDAIGESDRMTLLLRKPDAETPPPAPQGQEG